MAIKNLDGNLGRYINCGEVVFVHYFFQDKFFISTLRNNDSFFAICNFSILPTELYHSIVELAGVSFIVLANHDRSFFFSFKSVELYRLVCDVLCILPNENLCDALFRNLEASK